VTEAWREYESAPIIVRRARALERTLDTETIRIDPDDRIAGRAKRRFAVHRGMNEGYAWANQLARPEFTGGALGAVEDPPEDIAELFSYWRESYTSPAQHLNAMRTAEERQAMHAGVYGGGGLDFCHTCPAFHIALDRGLQAIADEARERLQQPCGTGCSSTREHAFYDAVAICCDAAIRYAERHADQAERLAADEADTDTRRELEQIAAICRRVPRLPAETFREALQCVWFAHIADEAECNGSAQSFGRFDQYLWPYYERDVADGRLTRDEALELVAELWLKCYKTFDFQYATIGGVRPDGSDATNELSYICLEALERCRTPRDVGVRIHAGTPRPFLQKTAAVASLGLGRPDIWNDDLVIQAFASKGIPLEDARDYGVIGCVELTLPGQCNSRTMCSKTNLSKCLELALNDGRCQMTGEQLGPATGESFDTYESLHAAYRAQARHFIALAIREIIRAQPIQAAEFPFPFRSAITEGCLESGRDIMAGGAKYNPAGVNLLGVANIADSLAAIKLLVFEQGRLSLDELRHALRSDFDGAESLRQLLLHEAPKFGNDDDYVDGIAADGVAFYCREVAKYRTAEGGPLLPLIFTTSSAAIYQYGARTGASADGRRAGEPLTPSCNPTHGADRSGPTASAASVAKVDYTETAGGVSYIMDMHPAAVSGNGGVEKLAALIRGYFDAGGMEISFNVYDEETLRAAQEQPDRYAGLLVRLFGFSTQFIALSREQQDFVIDRTRHGSG
jgi:formate C-acetyltransferase